MVKHKAHNESSKSRTADIRIEDETYFSSMLLPDPILKGLTKCGYKKPSPIQKEALPFIKCGMDLIIQAKAGTGKTCVFTIAALELYKPEIPRLQAVILAPTREIAQQITEVICAIGQSCQGLKTCCFVGGYALSQDEKNAADCHIAVGTPGRVLHLISLGILKTKHVKLFVLDEADKLLDDKFSDDINAIFSSLPVTKQVLACSATYTPEMVKTIQNYMHNGMFITPSHAVGGRTVLLGVRQFAGVVPYHVNKLARFELKQRYLLHLLRSIKFNQCLVFSNYHSRAMSVCKMLRSEDLSVEWIAGCQEQGERVLALSHLKEQRVRVLVTTDLTARGIDAENVNLVINLDVPLDSQTYLHRMGRAGRYGSYGMVITIVFEGEGQRKFQDILGTIGGTSQCVSCVPENLPEVDIWDVPDDDLEKLCGIDVPANGYVSNHSHTPDSVEVSAQENGDSHHYEQIIKTECNSISSNELGSCTCNLFEAKPEDIESFANPSLFSVSGRMGNWRNVLPLEVYEQKIPLNTPVILLGTKIIRVKNCEKIDERVQINIKESKYSVIKIETENCEKRLFDFEKLLGVFEYEESEEDCLEGKITLETRFSDESSEDEDDSSIQMYSKTVYTNKGVQLTDDKSKNIDDVLNKYEKNLQCLNSFLGGFEFVDIVGWMAVDENHKLLNDLETLDLDVFQFDLIRCVSGKNHIIASPFSNNSYKENADSDNHILTLNLDKLELSSPFSLAGIAEKLNEKKLELVEENCLAGESIGLYSNKSFEKERKSIVQESTNGITTKPLVRKDRWHLSSLKKNTTKESKTNLVKNVEVCPDSQQNSSIPNTNNKVVTQNHSSKQTKRYTDHHHTNGKPLLKHNTKNNSNRKQTCEYTIHPRYKEFKSPPNKTIARERIKIVKKSSSSDSTEESDTSSLSVSSFKSASEMNSSQSDASGPYVDMAQGLQKWQELHNNEESDTDSNTESECDQAKGIRAINAEESSSGTTRSEEILLGARCKEPSVCIHRERMSRRKNHHKSSSDSDDTVCSHHYLYQTPRLQNYGRFGDFNSSSYSKHEHSRQNEIPSNICDAHQRLSENDNKNRKLDQNIGQPLVHMNEANKFIFNPNQSIPSCSSSGNYEHSQNQIPPNIYQSHQRLKNSIINRKSGKSKRENVPPQTNEGHAFKFNRNHNMSDSSTKRTVNSRSSQSLSSQWFHNWYSQVRQQAEQIAYVEYIKAMSTL